MPHRQNSRASLRPEPSDGPSKARRPRPPLSPAERRRLDRHTVSVLAARGIDARPAVETALRVVGTDRVVMLDGCRERWASAQCGYARATAMALTFDAWTQQGATPLGDLRHVRLRPKGGKTAVGRLHEDLRTFSDDLGRELGRLVTARVVTPVLTAIHIRYDVDYGMWDLHAHILWAMLEANAPRVWQVLVKHFANAWQEPEPIRRPGALANYIMSGAVDYRAMPNWPPCAVAELWNLPRSQLLRPLGPFAAFRRETRGQVLRRGDGVVHIEDRMRDGRRRRQDGPAEVGDTPRVVAYTTARIDGQARLCAVLKRRRDGGPPEVAAAAQAETDIAIPPRADSRAGVPDSDNRRDSPPWPRAWGTEGVTWRDQDGGRWRFRLPPSRAWWMTAWPSVGARLSAPVLRRLPALLAHPRTLPRRAPPLRPPSRPV